MFVKGQSGNPAGKAAIPDELKAKLKDGFAEAVEFWFTTMRDESAPFQYRDKAAEKIAAYAYGKPKEIIDMDINARMTIESTFEYVDPVEPDADTE
jgi:hypothetical protein